MNHFKLIEKLESERAIKRLSSKLERKVLRRIDISYLFLEIPVYFKSLKKAYPNVLIYQGKMYKVNDERKVIKELKLKRWYCG